MQSTRVSSLPFPRTNFEIKVSLLPFYNNYTNKLLKANLGSEKIIIKLLFSFPFKKVRYLRTTRTFCVNSFHSRLYDRKTSVAIFYYFIHLSSTELIFHFHRVNSYSMKFCFSLKPYKKYTPFYLSMFDYSYWNKFWLTIYITRWVISWYQYSFIL